MDDNSSDIAKADIEAAQPRPMPGQQGPPVTLVWHQLHVVAYKLLALTSARGSPHRTLLRGVSTYAEPGYASLAACMR